MSVSGIERAAGAGALDDPRASLAGRRIVRLGEFEEAVALSDADREAYRRRFLTLFVDESRARRGGLGRVANAKNVHGETFALKMLILPEGDPADPSRKAREEVLRASFAEEYACHRALSGFKGFPRLYGRGAVDGVPALVMEWIEGDTLANSRRELAIDAVGRLSPLTVARIGRDLFDLLQRMAFVGEGFVHRDVSPANVMVRTGSQPVAEQAEEGRFDLALIDFGSASPEVADDEGAPFTSAFAVARRATADYAPPEMLSDDIPRVGERRRSPAVDVYEAASVLFELVAGMVPYAGGESAAPEASLFRRKMDDAPRPLETAHAPGADLARLLPLEPEVALAAGEVAMSLGVEPDSERLRRALALVDRQLEDLLTRCLDPHQERRPSALAMRDALSGFCVHYAQNVGRALRGEALIPCAGEASWLDSTSPWVLKRMLRVGGEAVSFAVMAMVSGSAALLASGMQARLSIGGAMWAGTLPAPAIAAWLLLPVLLGYLACGGRGRSRTTGGFLRGTIVLVAAGVLAAGIGASAELDPVSRARGLYAALFATLSAAWCPMVLEYATTIVPQVAGEVRRRLAGPRIAAELPDAWGTARTSVLGHAATVPAEGRGVALREGHGAMHPDDGAEGARPAADTTRDVAGVDAGTPSDPVPTEPIKTLEVRDARDE